MTETSWAERTTEELKADFPGVEFAFDFVKDSYASLVGRYQAVEGRLQSILTMMTAFTMGTVGFLRTLDPKPSFGILFWIAIGAFLLAILVGAGSLIAGSLELLSPRQMYPAWANAEEWEFKINLLIHASDDFRLNLEAINRKAHAAEAAVVLFAAEAALLVAWLVTS